MNKQMNQVVSRRSALLGGTWKSPNIARYQSKGTLNRNAIHYWKSSTIPSKLSTLTLC